MTPRLTAVVAMTADTQTIGDGGAMLWHIPSDLRRFKNITTKAGTMIMGRKTLDALRSASVFPLPDRYHVVLTRQKIFVTGDVDVANSVEEALALAGARGEEACVIGGGEVYRLLLPHTLRVKVTWVHKLGLQGDATFPALEPGLWSCVQRIGRARWNDRDQYPTSYEEYERV